MGVIFKKKIKIIATEKGPATSGAVFRARSGAARSGAARSGAARYKFIRTLYVVSEY